MIQLPLQPIHDRIADLIAIAHCNHRLAFGGNHGQAKALRGCSSGGGRRGVASRAGTDRRAVIDDALVFFVRDVTADALYEIRRTFGEDEAIEDRNHQQPEHQIQIDVEWVGLAGFN
jgi:hypothetical protein